MVEVNNSVQLIGTIGSEAETRYTPSGLFVCSFWLITKETRTEDPDTLNTIPVWHKVVVWEDVARTFLRNCSPSTTVSVQGRSITRGWHEGRLRFHVVTEIIGDTVAVMDIGVPKSKSSTDQRANSLGKDDVPLYVIHLNEIYVLPTSPDPVTHRLYGDRIIPPIPQFQQRIPSIPTFQSTGNSVLDRMLDQLMSPDDMKVQQATSVLTQQTDEVIINALISLLRPQNPSILERATEVLRKIGVPAIFPLITTAINTTVPVFVRRHAIDLLGDLGALQVVEPLITLLHHDDEILRVGAAIALGKIGDVRALSPLIEALKSPDPEFAASAAIALGHIHDPQVVEPLIEAMQHPLAGIRIDVAQALGYTKDSRSIAVLIDALQDNSPDVRFQAAVALGRLGDKHALAALEPLALMDNERTVDHEIVSCAAAMAVGVLGGPWAAHPLLQVVQETSHPWLYAAAMLGLSTRTNEFVVDILLDELRSPDTYRRYYAARTLGDIGDQGVIPALAYLVEYDPSEMAPGESIAHAASDAIKPRM